MTTLTRPGRILFTLFAICIVLTTIAMLVAVLLPAYRIWAALPLGISLVIMWLVFPFVVGLIWGDPDWSKTTRIYLKIIPPGVVLASVFSTLFTMLLGQPPNTHFALYLLILFVWTYVPFFLGRLVSRLRSQH